MCRLLYTCAHWHSIAKLRLHTDTTLEILDNLTTDLGSQLRNFRDKVCPKYTTKELSRETAARQRRKAAKSKTNGNPGTQKKVTPKEKRYNMQTYKHHALDDYADTIRANGTTDSYSTEPVSYGFYSYFFHFNKIHLRCRANSSTALRKLDIFRQIARIM